MVRKYLYFLFIPLCILFVSTPSVQAEAEPPFVLYKTWADETKVEVTVDAINRQMQVSMDTSGLPAGYYTTFIYGHQPRDWSVYDGVVITMKNDKESIRLNLAAELENHHKLSIADQHTALLQRKEEEFAYFSTASMGTFEIEQGFEGTIFFPFNHLTDTSTNESISAEDLKVISWGITISMEEGKRQALRIDDIQFVSGGSYTKVNELPSLSVQGDGEVMVPLSGESIAQYTLEGQAIGFPVSFGLMAPAEGAEISQDGYLTIYPNITADQLDLYAEINHQWRIPFTVKLFQSWTRGVHHEDGTSLTIPSEEEVAVIAQPSNPLFKDATLLGIRIALVTLGILLLLLYGYWRKRPVQHHD